MCHGRLIVFYISPDIAIRFPIYCLYFHSSVTDNRLMFHVYQLRHNAIQLLAFYFNNLFSLFQAKQTHYFVPPLLRTHSHLCVLHHATILYKRKAV